MAVNNEVPPLEDITSFTSSHIYVFINDNYYLLTLKSLLFINVWL